MKTLKELMDIKETDSPFTPVEPGEYTLRVANATYQEGTTLEDGREISPRVRLQLKVEDGESAGEVGRSAFVDLYIDQEDKRFGYVKRGYRLLTGEGLADNFGEAVTATNEELAQKFAAGAIGGQVRAKIGIMTQKNGQDANRVDRWIG